MFCRRCYAPLTLEDAPRCPSCNRLFDPLKPATFLNRPFPSTKKMLFQIVGTTILGIGAAYFVALHQMARNSGH